MRRGFSATALALLATGAFAQFNEGFEDVNNGLAGLHSRGWADVNMSFPQDGNQVGWFSPDQLGPHTGTYAIGANYNAVAPGSSDPHVISLWLFTPTVTLTNGSVLDFWTRHEAPQPGFSAFADRLQVRMSTNGSSTNVGNSYNTVGDFTTSLLEINQTQDANGYPTNYTHYSLTLNGVSTPVTGRFAFRYYLDPGGIDTPNGSTIAIDDARYTAAPVPEPATLAALGLGLVGLARRRRKA